jgi:allophanate hydrolase
LPHSASLHSGDRIAPSNAGIKHTPAKPGLVREPGYAGAGLEVEVWSLPPASFGRFVAAIPGPLGVGKVTLSGGRAATGFLCEAHALQGAREITALGGWRAYLADESGKA